MMGNAVKQYYTLESESDTVLFAQTLAQAYVDCCLSGGMEQGASSQALMVYLKGDLGAGKSFFSRAFIQTFLPEQKVKSPTYTIVESYKTPLITLHHFDLYRLSDPEELEYLAIRDLLTPPFVALVEWPQKGAGVLPDADVLITLQHSSDLLEEGGENFEARFIELSACSIGGGRILERVALKMSET